LNFWKNWDRLKRNENRSRFQQPVELIGCSHFLIHNDGELGAVEMFPELLVTRQSAVFFFLESEECEEEGKKSEHTVVIHNATKAVCFVAKTKPRPFLG
jgi:hypothetical protein